MDLAPYFVVAPVEIRLEVEEAVVKPRLRGVVPRPGLGLLAGKDDALLAIRRLRVTPHVPVAIRRIRTAAGRLKPRVLVRGVVDDEVEEDPDPALACLQRELGEVAEAAQTRVDTVVVRDVVAVVPVGRWVDRVEPQTRDAESRQVVQP